MAVNTARPKKNGNPQANCPAVPGPPIFPATTLELEKRWSALTMVAEGEATSTPLLLPNAVLVAVRVCVDDGQYTQSFGDAHKVIIESLKNSAFEPLSI